MKETTRAYQPNHIFRAIEVPLRRSLRLATRYAKTHPVHFASRAVFTVTVAAAGVGAAYDIGSHALGGRGITPDRSTTVAWTSGDCIHTLFVAGHSVQPNEHVDLSLRSYTRKDDNTRVLSDPLLFDISDRPIVANGKTVCFIDGAVGRSGLVYQFHYADRSGPEVYTQESP